MAACMVDDIKVYLTTNFEERCYFNVKKNSTTKFKV